MEGKSRIAGPYKFDTGEPYAYIRQTMNGLWLVESNYGLVCLASFDEASAHVRSIFDAEWRDVE